MVLFLLLSLTVTSLTAYAIPGTVSGTVRDDFEKDGYEVSDPPLSNSPSMRLLIGSTVVAGPINRNAGGGYTFSATPGNYTVEASCSGFVTQTKSVTITSGGNATRNFGLKRP